MSDNIQKIDELVDLLCKEMPYLENEVNFLLMGDNLVSQMMEVLLEKDEVENIESDTQEESTEDTSDKKKKKNITDIEKKIAILQKKSDLFKSMGSNITVMREVINNMTPGEIATAFHESGLASKKFKMRKQEQKPQS